MVSDIERAYLSEPASWLTSDKFQPRQHAQGISSLIIWNNMPVLCAQVDGKPFHFVGFNNYYLPTYSPWPQGRTDDVDVVFR